ncbi:MAG: hypothetical protein IPP66_02155 [Anaerolineales bacterium]|nr:hypothetical protein [Anaerolineales bacterium]
MKAKPIQFVISIIAIVLVIVHIVWPDLTIDLITVALLVIAIIPWLGSLFRAIELPGGVKVEYQELEKVTDSAKKAGLIKPSTIKSANRKKGTKKPVYEEIAFEDPNLALAGLRIEIEKRLIEIAKSHNINSHRTGVGTLSRILMENNILTGSEYSVLSDMVVMLNSAVHGAKVDDQAVKWALDSGNQILHSLDEKMAEKGK